MRKQSPVIQLLHNILRITICISTEYSQNNHNLSIISLISRRSFIAFWYFEALIFPISYLVSNCGLLCLSLSTSSRVKYSCSCFLVTAQCWLQKLRMHWLLDYSDMSDIIRVDYCKNQSVCRQSLKGSVSQPMKSFFQGGGKMERKGFASGRLRWEEEDLLIVLFLGRYQGSRVFGCLRYPMLKLKTDFIMIFGVLARGIGRGLDTSLSQKERHFYLLCNFILSLFTDFLALLTIRGTSIMPLLVNMFFSGNCRSWHCLAATNTGTLFFLPCRKEAMLSKLQLRFVGLASLCLVLGKKSLFLGLGV